MKKMKSIDSVVESTFSKVEQVADELVKFIKKHKKTIILLAIGYGIYRFLFEENEE